MIDANSITSSIFTIGEGLDPAPSEGFIANYLSLLKQYAMQKGPELSHVKVEMNSARFG